MYNSTVRLYGAVSPVKDQSVCGSCWSFGSVGTLEGALYLQTGQMTRLSQQALVDCSWGFGNNGCDGGEDWRVYKGRVHLIYQGKSLDSTSTLSGPKWFNKPPKKGTKMGPISSLDWKNQGLVQTFSEVN